MKLDVPSLSVAAQHLEHREREQQTNGQLERQKERARGREKRTREGLQWKGKHRGNAVNKN